MGRDTFCFSPFLVRASSIVVTICFLEDTANEAADGNTSIVFCIPSNLDVNEMREALGLSIFAGFFSLSPVLHFTSSSFSKPFFGDGSGEIFGVVVLGD